MSEPKISIIITYHNEEGRIKKILSSVINQSFTDTEIICINNGSDDKSSDIVSKFAMADNRIKLLNIPQNNDEKKINQIALGIASGEFVCFIETSEEIPSDYIKNLFIAATSNKESFKIEKNHMYRRYFLENNEEITSIIKEKMVDVFDYSCEKLKNVQKDIRIELDDFYQKNKDSLDDKTYDIYSAINTLKSNFSKKNDELYSLLNDNCNELKENQEQYTAKINQKIDEANVEFHSMMDIKGSDINKAFAEISSNYKYTEDYVNKKLNELNFSKNEVDESFKQELNEKIRELKKDIVVNYSSLRRIIDAKNEEINKKLLSINPEIPISINNEDSLNVEKYIKENINNMYEKINNLSTMFYSELSEMYKKLSEEQSKKDEEYRYLLQKITSEIKQDIIEELGNKIEKNNQTGNK